MPFNKKKIILARRLQITELYLKGLSQTEIATKVGVKQPQVSHDLKILSKEWKESALMNIHEAKSLELAKINYLECQYWDAWEESKKVEQQTTKRMSKNGHKTASIQVVVKEQIKPGNPKYLRGVQWCIQKRIEIFGINAPQQIEQKVYDEFEHMSDEELERYASGEF